MKKKKYNGKHLSLSIRIKIEEALNKKESIRKIGRNNNKAHNTISKEIYIRRQLVKGNPFLMEDVNCSKTKKSPFVCNGCELKKKCQKNKYFYCAEDAQADYRTLLVESRQGIDSDCEKFKELKDIVREDIDKGHSFAMIKMNHPEIDVCERTLYGYQDNGYFDVANIDLPRKVRYKKRQKKATSPKRSKRDHKILDGRRYTDFIRYIKDNNITYYVQMDTVEGIKGGECLLTFTFITLGTILAFKLEEQTSTCVSDKIIELKQLLGYEMFRKVFPVILTDNGSEFFNVEAIESNGEDIKDTKLFFCKPGRSDQKGSLENAHSYIRRFIEKGKDFAKYSDNDINRIVNNINSMRRKKYNPETAYILFERKFGRKVALKLGLYKMNSTEVIITSKLLKKPLTDEEIKNKIAARNIMRNAGKGKNNFHIK